MIRLAATVVAVLATALAATACGGSKTPSVVGTSPGLPSMEPKTGTPKSNPTTAAAAGPQIVYFRIKTKPSCPSAGPGANFPGNPIVLEWKVAGADQVTISIDGPGSFGTYDPVYQHEFPFPCSGASGSTQKHTFLLRTAGGGPVREQTVTGEARVN